MPHAKENQPRIEPQYQMLATYTVGGKWFCLVDIDKKFLDVKCAPETIVDMQSRYEAAFPAWHMNKEHWLGVKLEADMPDDVLKLLIQAGYDLIVSHLSKKQRKELLSQRMSD